MKLVTFAWKWGGNTMLSDFGIIGVVWVFETVSWIVG